MVIRAGLVGKDATGQGSSSFTLKDRLSLGRVGEQRKREEEYLLYGSCLHYFECSQIYVSLFFFLRTSGFNLGRSSSPPRSRKHSLIFFS